MPLIEQPEPSVAAWQAHFELIPAAGFPAGFEARLDVLAPRYRSWSADIMAWGSEDGDRIEVFHEAGVPTEAAVRIDMRRPDAAFIGGVLAWVRDAGLEMRDVEGRRVEATDGEFALALRGSRAYRFVEDPRRYLTRLRLGGLEDA